MSLTVSSPILVLPAEHVADMTLDVARVQRPSMTAAVRLSDEAVRVPMLTRPVVRAVDATLVARWLPRSWQGHSGVYWLCDTGMQVWPFQASFLRMFVSCTHGRGGCKVFACIFIWFL